ncbi:hypothetical protein ULMS_25900 [Patiriisocius marinistellae]|uniref:Secretion system C-terminal sorting domain-containing protein n=1 Tax=Patiriisocius marinistellae TaxID=2494560 RepID=A0A5J4G0H9_9FLAO|nr:T9SS type A sorting domain-containing protein [Patiriisocius marinistellae]GEQ87082.1 hypothetical protein ULMS_25900 [Patiriisocius marinistellae]
MKFIYSNFKSLIVVSLLFLTTISFAQSLTNIDYKEKVTDPNANFYEIVAQKRAEFALMDMSVKANNKEMKQFERWAYIWQDKVNADGSFPRTSNQRLSKEAYINTLMETQNVNNLSTTNPWVQVGPVDRPLANGYAGYPGKGRVNVITEDPNNTDIMYAGTAAGGVWKTTDNGTNWIPKSDFLAGLGVTDILVDPLNTNIIYMATGDEDGEHISSIGIFKSTDAGETWNPTGLTFSLDENEYIRDLTFAPNSSTKIFALTNDEIRVTTDSGASWNNVPVTYPYDPYTEGFQNIIFDPNDSMKAVVSDSFGGLYFSTDGGSNFALHATIEGLSGGQQKLKITSSANDPDFFYGILEDQRNNGAITEQATFRKYRYALTNSAADLISTTSLTGFNSQQGYNQNIAVSPINKNNIIVAGVNGFRSTNGGATFTTLMNAYDTPPGVGFYIHADHHHVSFVGNTEVVLNGHDGGVHKGPFNATSATPWDDLSNTLVITQPYNIAVTQEMNGDNFMMANQDNDGFSKILQGGSRNWLSAVAGDGTSTAIDISNSNIRYLGGTNGQLYRADAGYADGYDQATYILGSNTDAAFVSPMSVHPTDANIIYACHGDIKKSTNKGGLGDPEDFTALGSGLTGTKFIDVTANGGSIRIYTISENGVAKRTDDDGASWVTVTPPAGQIFNSFSALPNSTIVYATVSGYNAGNKVYKSIDSGASWTNLSAGLPNIIMKKVVLNRTSMDETLYLGTELGPYFRNNTTSWEKLGSGLPNVRVDDLEINYTDQKLYIGTFGRGMWGIEIANRCTGVTKTWDGTNWSPTGAPGNTDTVVINGNYSTTINGGSIDACSLTISGTNAVVTVGAEDYISVEHAAIVDAGTTLNIEHQGSFVQIADDAKVTNNGTINVKVTTPALNPRDFMLLGSPMSTVNREDLEGFRLLKHDTNAFDMFSDPALTDATNFVDIDNNDWSAKTGILNPSEGFMYWAAPNISTGGTYNLEFNKGTLNSGDVSYDITFGTDKNDSPNILSNPYASAIDTDKLIADNTAINEVYFWEHNTTPSNVYPGANSANFNMADISVRNAGAGVVSSTGGASPTQFMSTAQGFGIKAANATDVKFTNSMRVTSNNNTLRTSIVADKAWLQMENNSYSDTSTMAVVFTDQATAGYDADFDSQRLATTISFYSQIANDAQGYIIQSREALTQDMSVTAGFSSLIDETSTYKISLSTIEGDLIENATVYLIDNITNSVTNLTNDVYSFESVKGNYPGRFTILFENSSVLGVDNVEENTVSLYPNPVQDKLTIVSSNAMNSITITDLTGRTINKIPVNEVKAQQINLESLTSNVYFVTIESDNVVTTKRIIKN